MKCIKHLLGSRLKISLILISMLASINLYAQQIAVTGTIIDEQGETMPGVNILIKGTTTGVITDLDGKFSINVPDANAILTISFVGYTPQEITVGAQRIIHVTLAEAATELNEVVVIGYGTVKRKDLTGSVSSVSEKALKDIPVATAAEAITGKLPGVQVTTTEGSPDADIKIRVRGGGSITQSNSPLYIVDGFPMDNISDIAPSEIQSIDVLKDASSTAIYGSRGANGVILITTKSAKEGKFSLNYNGYYGVKKIAKMLDVLSPYDFARSQYERALLGNKVASEYEAYFGSYKDVDLYKSMAGTDWQDEMFGRTGTTQNHSISATGGSKVVSYNINYNYMADKAIMQRSDYTRNNFSAKLNLDPLEWLRMNLSVRYSDTEVFGAGANDVTGSEKSSSDSRVKNSVIYTPIHLKNIATNDDDAESQSNLYSPIQTNPDNDREKKNQMFNINGGVSIEPLKGLIIRSEIGFDSRYGEDNRFYGLTTYYVRQASTYRDKPAIDLRNTKSNTFRNTNTVTYTKTFDKKHNVSMMVGEETISTKSENRLSTIENFPTFFDSEMAWSFTTQGTSITTNNYYNPDDNLLSFFGRANYDYLGRYLLSVTFRADGSNKFSTDNNWGYFPSVAAAWRISDEDFMRSTNSWLSNLKLRASYGTAGNNNIPSLAFMQTYSSHNTTYIPTNLSSSTWTAGNTLPNPKLKWETTITRNVGLDFGLLKQRLSGSVEVYKNNTRDLLLYFSTSGSGYTGQYRNAGKTTNTGVEFNINAILIDTKDFTLNFGFNISANKNKVNDLGGLSSITANENWASSITEAGNSYRVFVDKPVGVMYGYVTDGMYSVNDFTWTGSKWEAKPGVIDNSSIAGNSWGPGALKLKKLSHSEDEALNSKITDDDRTIIGNATPKHFGAFSLSGVYKGFDFAANFNWVYGNKIYNANKIEFSSNYYSLRNKLANVAPGNYYSQVNFETGERVTDAAALTAMNNGQTMWAVPNRYVFHSWAVEDGSFLRLNNITIGYSLPQLWVSKIHLQQLRIYVSAQNLWVWTNYSGYDPEVDSRRASPLTPGVDYSAYPKSRSVNFGLNVTF